MSPTSNADQPFEAMDSVSISASMVLTEVRRRRPWKRMCCCGVVLVVMLLSGVALLLFPRQYSSEVFVLTATPCLVAIAAGKHADTEVTFTWLTNDTRDDESSCKEVAVVEIDSPNAVRSEVECLRYRYEASWWSGFDTKYTSGRIHRVRVCNLTADTAYRYSLAGDPERLHRRFRTLPAASSEAAYPLSFGVVGDLGQTEASIQTVRHLDTDQQIRMILHAGDMAYADSNAVRWDTYAHKVEPLASRTQWMVCPGNHEIESDYSTGYNFVPYEARFAMPRVKPAVNKPSLSQRGCMHPWPWKAHFGPDCTPSVFQASYDWGNSFYAFTAGPARVIALNTYTDTSPGSPQHTWLKAELHALKSRRAETPWLIVQMHCPFYNSNTAHHKEDQTVLMRDAHGFEDLFFENQVAIVLTGHVHAYERSEPVYNQTVNPKGPTYIVIGDGGNREGLARHYHDRPSWSAFRNGTTYGNGKITLLNSTHMLWEWLVDNTSRAYALSESSAVVVADKHVRAGSPSAHGPGSSWRTSLPARIAEDSAWITNPWSPRGNDAAKEAHEWSTYL